MRTKADPSRHFADAQGVDERSLRKTWLKRKFASWEYHEELLQLHEHYLSALHRHWADEQRQKRHPEIHRTMVSPVFLNFDKVQKSGETGRAEWRAGRSVGWAAAIAYNFNRGLGDFGPAFDEWADIAPKERDEMNALVGEILTHCTNIRRTIESNWERSDPDTILNERHTGPIDWPVDWKRQIADAIDSGLLSQRCEANHPCPREGFWSTPAKAGSRRHFSLGEVMPALTTDYGATIWQWDENQG